MNKVLYPSEKPWCICRLGADAQNRIIRRYANRQDADDDLIQVTRWLNDGGQYVVAFDVVEAPSQFLESGSSTGASTLHAQDLTN